MQNKPGGAALAALLITGMGTAAVAVPSFRSPLAKAAKIIQVDEDDTPKTYQWMLPSTIEAGPVVKEASFLLNDAFATFKGRSFNMEQGQLTVGVTSRIQLYYGEQFFLAKGRQSTSRLDVADSYYGVRAVIRPPSPTDPTSLSLQFQAIRPDTASAREGGTEADFAGTHNNVFSVNYLDRKQDQLQIQYTNITAPGGLSASVYNLGFGHDYQLSDFVRSRVQGALVAETFNGAGISSNFELRPTVSGTFAITPTPWLSLEADINILPAGMPLAGGEFTGLTSFDLYNPGGIVDDLRSGFIAYGSLRLLLHSKF